MKFIVDTHLPPRLARTLSDLGHRSWHVGEVLSLDAPDRAIWDFARAETCIVITKDSDFLRLSVDNRGEVPVLLLRIGNCSRNRVIEIVCARLPDIVVAFEAGEPIVEVR